jgi:hypothetical protein
MCAQQQNVYFYNRIFMVLNFFIFFIFSFQIQWLIDNPGQVEFTEELSETIRMVGLGMKWGQVYILLIFSALIEELRLPIGRRDGMSPQEYYFQLESHQ